MASNEVIKRLQAVIVGVGPGGIKRIPRYFRYFDQDGNKTISPDELKKCLKTCNFQISDNEVAEVFRAFDRDGSGKIDVKEFTTALEPKLNEKRAALVQKYFTAMDKTGDGVISVDDMKLMYGGSETTMQTFLHKFEVYEHADGKVQYDEFRCYYACMGAEMRNDADFEQLLVNDWRKL